MLKHLKGFLQLQMNTGLQTDNLFVALCSAILLSSDRWLCRRPDVRCPPHPAPHLPHEEEG